MAAEKRKWTITNGPSFLEGIILDHWRDGHRPEAYEKDLPYFTLEVGRTFSARIHGIFQVPHREDAVILLGEFAVEKLDGCDYFVMYYGIKGRHTGILEPMASLETDNPMLNECFPALFKKPESKNPVLAHLRSLPWEKKLELAKGFVEDLFTKHPNLAIAHESILSLLSRAEPQKQINVEMKFKRGRGSEQFLPDPADKNPATDLFFALSAVCVILNNFLYALGMPFDIIPEMQIDTVNDDVITLTTEQKTTNQ